jgi:hypothetical protein
MPVASLGGCMHAEALSAVDMQTCERNRGQNGTRRAPFEHISGACCPPSCRNWQTVSTCVTRGFLKDREQYLSGIGAALECSNRAQCQGWWGRRIHDCQQLRSRLLSEARCVLLKGVCQQQRFNPLACMYALTVRVRIGAVVHTAKSLTADFEVEHVANEAALVRTSWILEDEAFACLLVCVLGGCCGSVTTAVRFCDRSAAPSQAKPASTSGDFPTAFNCVCEMLSDPKFVFLISYMQQIVPYSRGYERDAPVVVAQLHRCYSSVIQRQEI